MRRLDDRGRLLLPEAAGLLDGAAGCLAASLRPDRWEMQPPLRPGTGRVFLDRRQRVHVPLGVRPTRPGRGRVVSIALDHSRLVIWPVAHRLAIREAFHGLEHHDRGDDVAPTDDRDR